MCNNYSTSLAVLGLIIMVRQADKTSTPPGLVFPDQSPIPIAVERGELLVLVTSCQATHTIHKHHWKQIMGHFYFPLCIPNHLWELTWYWAIILFWQNICLIQFCSILFHLSEFLHFSVVFSARVGNLARILSCGARNS